LALEPHDRMALREGRHGGGRHRRHGRHAEGVTARLRSERLSSNVPPHLVQRWPGHPSLRTTAIYGDVMGPEERAIATRMWNDRLQDDH
jgi:hypothetical protein